MGCLVLEDGEILLFVEVEGIFLWFFLLILLIGKNEGKRKKLKMSIKCM